MIHLSCRWLSVVYLFLMMTRSRYCSFIIVISTTFSQYFLTTQCWTSEMDNVGSISDVLSLYFILILILKLCFILILSLCLFIDMLKASIFLRGHEHKFNWKLRCQIYQLYLVKVMCPRVPSTAKGPWVFGPPGPASLYRTRPLAPASRSLACAAYRGVPSSKFSATEILTDEDSNSGALSLTSSMPMLT